MPVDQTFEEAVGTRRSFGGGRRDDMAESAVRTLDETVKERTGTSLFHMLTLGSIAASIILFLSGRRAEAIFVGLWPPTFQALKAASEDRGRGW